MQSRRNILTMLGLASVVTPALATDDLVATDLTPYRIGQHYNPERMARALERLATEVRNNGVNISRFHIGSELGRDDWLRQTLTIDVEILHDE